jgi:hypothetical protein
VSAAAEAQEESQSMSYDASAAPPGFGARGRVRRRARFLRRARELAYRDLGGLVFNLHRFGQRNDGLVLAKLSTLSHIDSELRALESALAARRPVTVLREAGITACPRCAAIHSSEDHYCPNCGLPVSRRVDLPIAGASAAATPAPSGAVGSPAVPPSPFGAATASPATPTSSPAGTPPAPSGSPASPRPSPAVGDPSAPPAAAAPGISPAPTPDRQAPTTQSFPAQAPATQRFPAQTPSPASSSDDEPTEIVRPPAAGT